MRFEYKGKERYIMPRAIPALRSLEGIPLYHTEYSSRHPLEIYTTTFYEVVEETVLLQRQINELSKELPHLGNKKKGWEKRLASSTDNWLDSIVQHIDSCKGVLSSFFSRDQEKQKQKCIKSFSTQIEQYRKEAAIIVNYIKHKQRFVRIVYFHWVGGFVPGFFIEGIVEDGVLGPDPVIHKHSNTAISFNRYLPFYFCSLYCVSSVLAQSIYEITKKRTTSLKNEGAKIQELEEALKMLSVSPLVFFPDELKKPVPYIKWHFNEMKGTASILLEYPSKKGKPSTVPENCRIGSTLRIGEISKTYKLPYFGSDVPIS